MNWFTMTMYARARKKGMTPSTRFAPSPEPAASGDKKHFPRAVHTNGKTVRLRVDPVKEIA